MLPSFKKKLMGGHAEKFVKVTWPFFYIKNSPNSGSFKICYLKIFLFSPWGLSCVLAGVTLQNKFSKSRS